MATYVFKCTKCGEFEAIVPMGTKQCECPKCKELALKDEAKSMGGQQVIFKGSGWTTVSGKGG